MTASDLDTCYGALCEALAAAGPDKAPLLLSMLSLSLMSRADDPALVRDLIAQAARQATLPDGPSTATFAGKPPPDG